MGLCKTLVLFQLLYPIEAMVANVYGANIPSCVVNRNLLDQSSTGFLQTIRYVHVHKKPISWVVLADIVFFLYLYLYIKRLSFRI